MATRTLALPSWMNVVLEGGGLELERAAVEYERLRALLQTDWKPRALEVVALTTSVATREFAVLEAEQRAQKRESSDPEFARSRDLRRVVKARRAELAAALRTSEAGLCAALDVVRAEADEASRLARAWRQLAVERTAWMALLVAMFAAAPAVSYLVAKDLGGVKFDFGGLLDSPASVLALLIACAVGAVSQARLSAWDWLRTSRPLGWNVTLALLGFVTAAPLLPFDQGLLGAVVFAATGLHLGRQLLAWRRSA